MTDRLIVTLSIGDEAQSIGSASMPLMQAYASRCHADFKVLGATHRSAGAEAFYEKFQIRELLDQYQRVLYIDLDVLVNPMSPDLFEQVPQNAFAATSVETVLSKAAIERRQIQDCLGDIDWSHPYFNAGVMLFGQSAKPMLDFCEKNQNTWVQFIQANNLRTFHDQTLLNYALNQTKTEFCDLGRSFNFTRAWQQFNQRFSHHFIHYAGLSGNRDWQMHRDFRVFNSPSPFWLLRKSPSATWVFDRLSALNRGK